MRNRLTLFLLLCATGAAAQIPTLTNAAKIRYVQGNTVFDRPASDLLALVGAENITVTGNWTFSSNLTQLKDAGTYFYDDGDNTKLLRFQLSGITTGTTRNLTVPNADGTIALTGAAYGGTGQSAVAQGDILYGSATDTWSRLAKNTSATRYLSNTGTSNNPAWAQIDLTNGVTGALPVANGGTGATTFTNNRLLTGNGTSAIVDEANATFDGSRLTITGTQTIGISTPSATQHALRFTNSVASATNNVTQYGGRSLINLTNDGTPTGNNLTHWYAESATSSPTKLTSLSGFNCFITNTSADVTNAYGMYGRLDEGSATTVSNRYGLRFDLNRTTNNTDTHTGYGIQANIADNSTSGRWTNATGVSVSVTNALTGTGGSFTVVNSRGTANTQTGLSISNTTSGSGVTTSNAYGLQLTHSEASSGSISTYYGIISTSTPAATTNYGLYFSGASWRNYLNGSLALGTNDNSAQLFVRGSGATSGTNTALFENSSGTDILTVRDDGMSAFGTTPVSTERLTVRGSTSDNTAKAFVAERSSGTDLLGVQNDGKVSINNAAYTEELTINGQAQLDGVIYTNQTGSVTASGHVVYNNGSGGSYSGYLTVGDGTRQLALMPTMIERHVIDYAVDWTTGRKGAFWTVPARFDGWKIAKAYIEVTSVGSGSGDDELTIEIGGVGEGVQIITAGTHTLVMDDVVNTDDVVTFNVTAISATPAKGLNVSLELSKN